MGGFRSAAPSSKRMAAVFTPVTDPVTEVRASPSSCRPLIGPLGPSAHDVPATRERPQAF
jgi:hypothetical protein